MLAFYLTTSFASLVLSTNSSECYWPDGNFESDYAPCYPDQEVSVCCGQGHSCMSNGLCRWPDDEMTAPLTYVRGGCTDKSCEPPAFYHFVY